MTHRMEISVTQQANIEALLKGESAIPARGWLARECSINYEAERTLSQEDPDAFWAEKARALDWAQPWSSLPSALSGG